MATTYITSADKLSEAIDDILTEYNETVVQKTKEQTKKAMDQLVKETKATAPVGHRRSHHYKNSITSRTEWENNLGCEMTWYVRGSDYRLSHLLENGHALWQGGRASGTHFIKNASDPIIEDYVKAIEEVLRNG